MKCQNCHKDIRIEDITIEESADEQGVEVNFVCLECGKDFYVVLQPEIFEEVD